MGEHPLRLGRFQIKSLIGIGAMGKVYLADDPRLGREIALKIIRADRALTALKVEELRSRFDVEARAAARLSHPNIITIHDFGRQDDLSYIVMEYVRGESLEEIIQSDRALSFKEISDLAVQLASALDYAHRRGVIHRDVKPANVLISMDGRPKLADFGVAKLPTSALTQTGIAVGTPAYMSPEQITGVEVTSASDQFSLGSILYLLLAGQPPFPGTSTTTILYKIVNEEPAALRSINKQLPGEIDHVVMRALSKDPSARYPRCMDFGQAVREALRAAPVGDGISTGTIVPADSTLIAAAENVVAAREELPGDHAELPAPVLDDTEVLPLTDEPEILDADPADVLPLDEMLVVGAAESRERAVAGLPVRRFQAPLLAVAALLTVAVVLTQLDPGDRSQPVLEAVEEPGARDAPAIPPEQVASDGTPTPPAEVERTWWLTVNGEPPGASIWVDGEATGQVAPADVELLGARGSDVRVELRQDNIPVASAEIQLGSSMPRSWPPISTVADSDGADRASDAVPTVAVTDAAETDVAEAVAPEPDRQIRQAQEAEADKRERLGQLEISVADAVSRRSWSVAALQMQALVELDPDLAAARAEQWQEVIENGQRTDLLAGQADTAITSMQLDDAARALSELESLDPSDNRISDLRRRISDGREREQQLLAPVPPPRNSTPSPSLPTPLDVSVTRAGQPVAASFRATLETLIYEEQLSAGYDLTLGWSLISAIHVAASGDQLLVLAQGSEGNREILAQADSPSDIQSFLEFARERGVQVVRATSDLDLSGLSPDGGGPDPPDAGGPDPAAGLGDGTVPLTPEVVLPQLIPESVRFEMSSLEKQALNVEMHQVTIRCLVGSDGRVVKAKLFRIDPDVSGFDSTKADLVRAIEQGAVDFWRFVPATLHGEPVSVWHMLTLQFGPSDSGGASSG